MTAKFWLPVTITFAILAGCGEKQQDHSTHFTKADSLTETYLALQDSMLAAWNVMINDDNQKIQAMRDLTHEMAVSGEVDKDVLARFDERIDRLRKLRYTQKSMWNSDVVNEYDFASGSLVTELIALAESQRQFAYNPTLQKLVDNIKTADQRVEAYREQYDLIAMRYNGFIRNNSRFLEDLNSDSLKAKPLFEVASGD